MTTTDPNFRPLDPGRVNFVDPVECAYWCHQFGCTPEQLNAAVDAVGEHVTEVREWLARDGQG